MKLKALGFEWWTLQLDYVPEQGAGAGMKVNESFWPAFKAAGDELGLLSGPWYTKGGNIGGTPADADFTIAEHESEEDRAGTLAADSDIPAGMPRGLVTNFTPYSPGGVYDRDLAKPFIDRDYVCLVEAYLSENDNLTPERLDWTARVQLGFPFTQPVFGIYPTARRPDVGVSTYDAWRSLPGWSDYLIEYRDL